VIYTPYQVDNSKTILSQKYFVVPAPGNTQTRQVLPFKIHDTPGRSAKSGKENRRNLAAAEVSGEELTRRLRRGEGKRKHHLTETNTGNLDLVLEVNSGQTSNIYFRTSVDLPASKTMPLPGSQGDEKQSWYARAGDTLVIGETLYVILAMYNGNNTVWSFSTDVF
jgi:hypothetical protein